MKRISIIYVWLSLLLCIVCNSCEWGLPPNYQRIVFFQLSDTTILHKVSVIPQEHLMIDDAGRYYSTTQYAIPTYPKLDIDAPYFTELDNYGVAGMKGAYYDVCELATETKYIALKNGYYMVYPYTNLCGLTTFLNVDWKDLCNVDIDTIQVMRFDEEPFSKVYNITEETIAKLTRKSTPRFKKRNKEQVRVEDIVQLLNQLIEEDDLDSYCNGMGFVVGVYQ